MLAPVNDLDIAGIEFVSPVNFTIVTVQAPKAEAEPEAEEVEVGEEAAEEVAEEAEE